MNNKIWLVTGVSSGLGKALAEQIYAAGDIVIGTVRKQEDKKRFEDEFKKPSIAFIMDLTSTDQITSVVNSIKKDLGKIDILVNNAGYGLFGLIEEVSEKELRQQLEVSFIGPWLLTKEILPLMRKQKEGHIIQISSRMGIKAGAEGGAYASGKFALEGMTEALAEEVAPFNIKTTLVEPGALRTNFFGGSVLFAKEKIKEYHTHMETMRTKSKKIDGNQPGDPIMVANEIISISKMENPPFRLPLTQGAIDSLEAKMADYKKTIKDWKETAKKVDSYGE